MAQKSKKNLTVIVVVAVIVVGWFVAAQLFGPNSERGITKEVERLTERLNSIARQLCTSWPIYLSSRYM